MSEIPEEAIVEPAIRDALEESAARPVEESPDAEVLEVRTKPFGVEVQYIQMQEARRQWERFIWQSPVITTTLVGISFAALATHSVPYLCGNLPLSAAFFLLAAFTFVIGMWGHRSRLLLRATEATLSEIEKEHFDSIYPKYPFQLNESLERRFDRISSTTLIVRFMLGTAVALLLLSGAEMGLNISGSRCTIASARTAGEQAVSRVADPTVPASASRAVTDVPPAVSADANALGTDTRQDHSNRNLDKEALRRPPPNDSPRE
jgi:hypothetical protein